MTFVGCDDRRGSPGLFVRVALARVCVACLFMFRLVLVGPCVGWALECAASGPNLRELRALWVVEYLRFLRCKGRPFAVLIGGRLFRCGRVRGVFATAFRFLVGYVRVLQASPASGSANAVGLLSGGDVVVV